MHFLDEMLDHLFRDIKIGDHAIFQRANDLNIVRRLAHHQLGISAHGPHLGHAVIGFQRDHRRFIEYDSLITQVDQRIGSAEVDRNIMRLKFEETTHI